MTPLEHAAQLIEPIRAAAMSCGYAVGIHGSLQRDIDLIAVPWIENAKHPDVLFQVLLALTRGTAHPPRTRPHGRIVRIIELEPQIYIDLSIFPRKGNHD